MSCGRSARTQRSTSLPSCEGLQWAGLVDCFDTGVGRITNRRVFSPSYIGGWRKPQSLQQLSGPHDWGSDSLNAEVTSTPALPANTPVHGQALSETGNPTTSST
jgi:hypothetical protein